MRSNDSTWNPTIFISTQKVRVNTTPRFISVILDRSLTFNAHLKKITMSLSSSIRIIREIAHMGLAPFHSTNGFLRTNLQQAWLSSSCMAALAFWCQHLLFRLSTRLFSSTYHRPAWTTPLEAFRLEADVQSYHTCSNRLILDTSEKALHSTNDYPTCVALADDIPQRLQNRSSFFEKQKNFPLSCHPHFN